MDKDDGKDKKRPQKFLDIQVALPIETNFRL